MLVSGNSWCGTGNSRSLTAHSFFGRGHRAQVMFLFTETHIANEGFLEAINNMLTSGMVPGLFSEPEKQAILDAAREEINAKVCLSICPSVREAGHPGCGA
jgi:P-loop containing dynein motor region D4